MAATAYAFLVSLMNTMDQIQTHPRLSTCFDNHQFQSLREMVDSLLVFVENHSDEEEDLLNRIAVVAQKAEDLIEVETADQIRDVSTTQKTQSFLHDLQTKIQEMDCIIKEEAIVIKVKEDRPFQDDQHQLHPKSSMAPPPPPSSISITKTSRMVGFDGYLEKLLDELTGYHCGRRILPIVGMGGIGKTTLARNVYQNSLIAYHFDVRAWVTVSQQYNPIEILFQALTCLGASKNTGAGEVGEVLHKALSGRRYLVVLDDMWSVEAWEKIKFYFPENNNRSRIVVTTRQQQLVDYFASSSVAVDFLDDKNSWELFCDKIFGHHEQGGCPHELEEVGEKIVRRCKGLPLAITVIGGLLRKLPKTLQYWVKIAEDKSFFVKYSSGSDEGKNPLSILYTSYKHLPVCFKSCFLYLGLFPEDHQIDASQLIKFLVAEGFIKPNRNQTLEEVAQSCIMELVDRNLLLVGNLGLDKKVRTYHVHDLVRDLMISIAEKENFYCVQRDIAGTCVFIIDEATASFYRPEPLASTFDWELPISIYRPLIYRGQNGAPSPCTSRLQRVMVDVGPLHALCEDVNLRLIYDSASQSPRRLPSSTFSLFWSLQTIIFRPTIIHDDVVVPVEIWKMRQLRHIEISSMHLPDPCTATGGEDVVVLHNLQTLKRVRNLSWSEEVCKRIPNVKEVEIYYDSNEQDVGAKCFHLHNLNKLEWLRCYSYIEDPSKNLKLPNFLKELILVGCGLAWSDLEMIGALPHLQILALQENAVVGAEWDMGSEVEFLSLKHLRIGNLDDLITWIADASNFPVLETLFLWYLDKLEEIPPGIGEIPTLETIRIDDCSKSVIMSAIRILEEQESLGNEDLQLQLNFFSKDDAERWREEIQELGITSQNFHIFKLLLW